MCNFRWWSAETIAVVTGANRGIGFEIAHQLALQGVTVVLTSRETAVGEESAKVLQEGGLKVVFHQLDVLDQESIDTFCAWIKENYGGIDILVIDTTLSTLYLMCSWHVFIIYQCKRTCADKQCRIQS